MVRLRFGFMLFLSAAAEELASTRSERQEASHFLRHVPNSAGVGQQLAGQDTAAAPSPGDELAQLREEVNRLHQEVKNQTMARKIANIAAKAAMKNATAEAVKNAELERAVNKNAAEKSALEANFSQVQQSLQKQLDEARKAEHAAEGDAKAAKEKYIIEERYGYLGPLGAMMAVFPQQGLLATAALAVGLISVVGPNTLLDCWFALIGCVLGGLLVGSSVCFCLLRGGTPWVDVMSGMVHFSMEFFFGYPVWAAWTFLGLLRYWTGCRCQLYAAVPQIKIDSNSGRVSTPMGPITTPLLHPNANVSRPPRPPGQATPQPTPPPSVSQGHDGPVRPSGETTPRGMRSSSPASSGRMPQVTPTPSNGSRPSGRRAERPDLPKPAPSKSTGILSQGMQKVASLGSKSNSQQGHQ